ncbi:hypothetical protein PV08_05273 [Exophiala spinifera]|uniref:Fe2OG dioxygenase domain-containing protein n=1 Tax=Exophiala spinifera TaxID=91928 RepID=A0A0D2B8G3_9EURO|nr:uncharacterized protein PV08_05273 [Exophiala spinifera]KIW15228.1 hypothetical protein PV08_05273 [Exophiala spinifera]
MSAIHKTKSTMDVRGSTQPAVAPRSVSVTRVTDEERLAGTTSFDTIQAAYEGFNQDGFSVLTNAIDPDIVDKLNAKMLSETSDYLSKPSLHFNQGQKARNISQTPPLNKEWMFREIWANPHAMSVLEYILGPEPELRFVNSNVALPNKDPSARQAVHSDAYHDHPDYPWAVVLNIYLCDVGPENGATEVWPGTHRITGKKDHVSNYSGRIRREVFCERAKVSPPSQVRVPKGSLCFRDLRTWHAGMPNLSDDPRVMLALVYFPKWYRSPMRLTLPRSVREEVNHWEKVDFEAGTDWVDGEIKHLEVQFQANWTQDVDFGVFASTDGKGIRTVAASEIEPEVTRQDYWVPGDS